MNHSVFVLYQPNTKQVLVQEQWGSLEEQELQVREQDLQVIYNSNKPAGDFYVSITDLTKVMWASKLNKIQVVLAHRLRLIPSNKQEKELRFSSFFTELTRRDIYD
jgi:hypothetical protein